MRQFITRSHVGLVAHLFSALSLAWSGGSAVAAAAASDDANPAHGPEPVGFLAAASASSSAAPPSSFLAVACASAAAAASAAYSSVAWTRRASSVRGARARALGAK